MISSKEIEVRYGETDQMGVVYHANYLVWLELGRTQFFKDLGFDMMDYEQKGYLFPVREVNITYLNPVRFSEETIIETSVEQFSKVKTIYKQVIKNTQGDIKATANVTVVCVRKNDFRLVSVEKELPEIFNTYKNLIK